MKVASKRRSKLDLYFEILQSINEGNNKVTYIMKEVNIAWTPLKDILYSLQQHNIIEVVDAVQFKDKRTSVHYNLTTKGLNVYKYLRNTKNNINEILSMLS